MCKRDELIQEEGCGNFVEPNAGETEMVEAIQNAMKCTGMRENVLKHFTLKNKKINICSCLQARSNL